jgi:hypothetical protein
MWAIRQILRKPLNKRILLTFCGSIDRRCEVTTIGDLMALYNVAICLRRSFSQLDIAWNGGLFDLSQLCVNIDQIDKAKYDAVLYVCGPLTRGHPAFFAQFPSAKKIAVGVSITNQVDPFSFVDSVHARDSESGSNFDLALADIGYPHFNADPRARDNRIAVCLVGDQAEYGVDDGYDRAAALVEQATGGCQTVSVQTLLDTSRPIPASVELDLQCASSLITTRMHGALLAIYHGVPVISIDQIRGGAKVTRMLAQLEWPVFNSWTDGPERISAALDQYRRAVPSSWLNRSRDLLLKRSRLALKKSITFILDEMKEL